VAVIFYVAPVVLLGLVVIAAAIKVRGGRISPGECPNCGGLISPNAPYCKHCGAPVD
jgi:predicted amidophosphoribosyltransferase